MSTHAFNKHFHTHSNEFRLGGVTLHVEMDRISGEYEMSWAVCSPEDNFCRKTGEQLAIENMSVGLYVRGVRDFSLPVEVDLISTLESAPIVDPSARLNAEYYRSKALSNIHFVCVVEALEEAIASLEEDVADLSHNPVYQNRNYLIDSLMVAMPFLTSNFA